MPYVVVIALLKKNTALGFKYAGQGYMGISSACWWDEGGWYTCAMPQFSEYTFLFGSPTG